MDYDCRGKRLTILFVEDDPLVRWMGAESLVDAGFTVLEAGCAEEALVILQSREDVSLLFTDIDMPGAYDGLELADIAHRRWPHLHILIASGRCSPRKIPENGRFLPKPYAPDQVTRQIDAMFTA
jgi:CheY-like chemotaxis protein